MMSLENIPSDILQYLKNKFTFSYKCVIFNIILKIS